ncbi:Putative U-box domain-containing 53 -like protein [Gossypium arboreum]|uniref:Putative U-box domain-containing 53-like protein n=1 Tax=Gossypium arboreum TaxID=29729 RepID=A0A0B0MB44_GOSAR|nr:Putative U-box domain-containing 53 -like protein [Gossypium arboreum]
MVPFNHGLTHFISCFHGIFQPWSFQPLSYTFHIMLPWYLSTMVLFISYHVATFHFREHTPANLILTAGFPVQAKSPVTTITLMNLDLNYQSRLNSNPNSDYPFGLNPFYTYSSGGLY